MNATPREVPDWEINYPIAYYGSENGWSKFSHFLSKSIIHGASGSTSPGTILEADHPSWRWTFDGQFSLKLAYEVISSSNKRNPSSHLFNKIWKLEEKKEAMLRKNDCFESKSCRPSV
ncbi:hypothetical protein VNO77_16752 [Canavalia gladiata]|uniref:Uncharacterized protein n=1 Tax=Canavalia gladiata TaxID=3824 RepID=A0AAN9LMK8_CANGL